MRIAIRLLLSTAAAVLVYVAATTLWSPAAGKLRSYPPVKTPPDNPLTKEKAALGRRLFYDRRLSVNETISCGDCHRQEFAFSDPRPRSRGATGESTARNAMTLTNVAFNARYTWADASLRTLEEQLLIPLTHRNPLEMGVLEDESGIMRRLSEDREYPRLFAAAFPGDPDPIDLVHVVRALSSFVRTIVSADSPFDRFLVGDEDAITEAAKRGFALFRSERFGCGRCHSGSHFRMTPGHRSGQADDSVAYHNTGLYNLGDNGSYPASDRGLFDSTGAPEDMGRFKAPTLRNVGVTAPYMHDGSIATLDDVLDHYAAGGRTVPSGDNAGVGRDNPHKSTLIRPFEATRAEKQDVVAFLHSLTDEGFLVDTALSNPFRPPAREPSLLLEAPGIPQMVIVPGGEFRAHRDGAGSSRAMRLLERRVRVPQRLAVARTETTVAEFRRFVDATGYHTSPGCMYHTAAQEWVVNDRATWDSPVFEQTETHPVTCVTFGDAQAYANWVSRVTGHTYRLPTEDEFEYFNRGGRDGDYGVNAATPEQLCAATNGADRSTGFDYATPCSDGHAFTAPVGRFPANGFGLYDTTGNVWELTLDCWQSDYARSLWSLLSRGPRNASEPHGGTCDGRHVARGGSYLSSPRNLRAAQREIEANRDSRTGFRLVRPL
jgi:cytochrome c peroxidase